MECTVLNFMWIMYSSIVTFVGINVLFLENKTPEFLRRMFKFGKSNKDLVHKKSFVKYFEVPKRWFSHFYIFSTIYFVMITLEVWRRYFFGSHTAAFDILLDVFTSKNRKSSIPAESVVVLSILLLLQVSRRCYECLCVSVYSDGKMNITHYIVGLTFYFGAGLSLLCEAPGFESKRSGVNVEMHFGSWLSLKHFTGIVIFLIAFMMQYQVHVALASFRKDEKGKRVVTTRHVMPGGAWFKHISCPHYFAEIVMYLSANLIMDGQSKTWWLVCVWVVCNQIISGLMSHQWYRKTFKDYPKSRKAVIPWLL